MELLAARAGAGTVIVEYIRVKLVLLHNHRDESVEQILLDIAFLQAEIGAENEVYRYSKHLLDVTDQYR